MQNKIFSLLALSLMLSACGRDDKMATVTLLTGLEHNPTKNLMTSLTNQMSDVSAFSAGPSNCIQPQILAGFGPSGNNNNISFFPVGLATTMGSGATAFGPDPASWLTSNSDLKPINIPAPIGQPLDFGIIGALIDPTNGTSGQNCPSMLNLSTSNQTYSLIGHAQATISGNTVVPINTWVIDPYVAPLAPTGACAATGNNGGGTLDQTCANRNYYYIRTTTSCGGYPNYRIEYASGINGTPPVVQILKCSGGMFVGARIPNLAPLTITAVNSTGVDVASGTITKAQISHGFVKGFLLSGGQSIDLEEQGGVGTPGAFNLTSVSQSGSGLPINLVWNAPELGSSFAVFYSVGVCPGNATGVITAGTWNTGTLTGSAPGQSPATTVCIAIKATNFIGNSSYSAMYQYTAI